MLQLCRARSVIAFVIFFGSGIVFAQTRPTTEAVTKSATRPTTKPTTRRPLAAFKGPPDLPFSKHYDDGTLETRFKTLHESFLARARQGPIGLLFLGDSITEGWYKAKPVWKQYYEKYHPANFGIGGDRTEHVLWRIENGELDGITPKVVVLMIGPNNLGSNSADQITKADLKIVTKIHEKLPHTKVLILGIFPRGHDPKDPLVAAMRSKLDKVNKALAKLDGTANTRYLDIGAQFLDKDGVLQPQVMDDYLHPTRKGYEIWAVAMQPTLEKMMR